MYEYSEFQNVLYYKINRFTHLCLKYFTNKSKRPEKNTQCKLLVPFCGMNYFGTGTNISIEKTRIFSVKIF